MATNFPGSADSFTNPTSGSSLSSPSHADQHTNVNDAVEAIETALLDGAPLKIDDANNRVGIGTTTPTDTLDVNGTLNVRDHIDFSDTTPDAANRVAIYPHGYDLYVDNAGAGADNTRLWLDAPDEGEVVIGPRAGASTLGNMRIRSDDISLEGDTQVTGRLGIGSGISAELDIKGASNPEIRLQSTDSTDPFLYFGDQVDAVRGGIGFDTSANALILRGYNNSTRMTIDSAGRVSTPNVPAFRARAYYTDSHSAMGGQQTATFYDVNLNNGNHFLTSGTGAYQRFVAPVAGYYWFHLYYVPYQCTGGYYYGFQFRKNNVQIEPHHYIKAQSSGNDDGGSLSLVEYCNANDYVTCVTNFQDTRKLQVAVFTGHMIG